MTEQSSSDHDVELVRLILAGQQGALLEIYQRHGDAVYALALRVLNQPQLAEEVTQDVFLKVWRRAAQWDPDQGKFISWLLAITRNAAIDYLRKENRRPPRSAMPLENAISVQDNPSQVNEPNWENGQLLRALMVQLPWEQRTVIELAYYAGMTHSEIAEHLDWPVGTVKTRIRLGMEKLRHMWKEATASPPDEENLPPERSS